MKAFKVGMVSVAILLVVTGVGFGIAQAGGNHTDRPVLSFEDQELLQVAKSPAADFDPFSRSEDMQLESPIETGSLPKEELRGTEFPFPVGFVAEGNADSSIVEIDGIMYYRVGEKLYGPY